MDANNTDDLNLTGLPMLQGINVDELRELFCKSVLEKGNLSDAEEFGCDQTFETTTVFTVSPPRLGLSTQVILTVLYGVIFLVSIAGNVLVIAVYLSQKALRNVTCVFIISLAASDLLMTLVCVPINMGMLWTQGWVFGDFACKTVPYIQNFSVTCSSLTLSIIAVDRFYATVYPLRRRHIHTVERALKLMSTVWFVAATTSLPNAIQFTVFEEENGDGIVTFCMWPGDGDWSLQAYCLITMICMFIIPLVLMSVLYMKISHYLWVRKAVGCVLSGNEAMRMRFKKRALKMLIAVVIVFVVCWAPLKSFIVFVAFSKPDATDSSCLGDVKLYFQIIALSSTCYNPVIYTLANSIFRKRLILSWRKKKLSNARARALAGPSTTKVTNM